MRIHRGLDFNKLAFAEGVKNTTGIQVQRERRRQ